MLFAVRILGVAFLTTCLALTIGLIIFHQHPGSDSSMVLFLLGCLGAFIGVLAGGAIEIVLAIRSKNPR
jgi:hypothetical protein